MIFATVNQFKQVIIVNYLGHIKPVELKQSREELKSLLAELRPGFRMLVDLSQLESMGLDCRAELGRNMDMFSQAGVGAGGAHHSRSDQGFGPEYSSRVPLPQSSRPCQLSHGGGGFCKAAGLTHQIFWA